MANLFDDLIQQYSATDPMIGQPEELSLGEKLMQNVSLPGWMDDLRGSTPYAVMRGMAKPVVGAVQAAANVLPDSTGIPTAVNRKVDEVDRQYQTARAARGRDGFDAAEMVGEVLSPANYLLAARAPMAATTLGRIGQGAAIGGASGGMQPVSNGVEDFWSKKAGQVASGAAAGAVLTPVLGAVGDRATALVGRLLERGRANPALAAAHTDAAIDAAMKDLGQTIHDIPPAQLEALRGQVGTALREGKQIDPAAVGRAADFEALGMKPTLGQLTRDPRQFTREKTLAGVSNLGEDLSMRFEEQGRQLRGRFDAANGAKDAYSAGTQLSESLAGVDDKLRRHVSGLYGEARATAGKDLDVPLQGLAQDYAQVLSDFGDRVPGAIRSKFAALGLDPLNPSNQRQVFTFEKADHLLKVINAHTGSDPATNRALGQLRDAVKSAVSGADAGGGPFAPAVKAAAERFKMHDAIPALKAAAEGSVAPERFVEQFVVSGRVNEVKGLAGVLKQADPAGFQEARAQIADTLKRAAFGENPAGDAPFNPSAYMRQIRRLGPDKLGAFFNAQELTDLMRVGRVGAYIHSAPNAATVNTSNTASAAVNLLARVPGVSPVVGVGNRMAGAIKDNATVRNALAAKLDAAPLPAERVNWLRYLLSGGAAAGGSLAGRD